MENGEHDDKSTLEHGNDSVQGVGDIEGNAKTADAGKGTEVENMGTLETVKEGRNSWCCSERK